MPVQHPVPDGSVVAYRDAANSGTTFRVESGPHSLTGDYTLTVLDGADTFGPVGSVHRSDLRQYGWTLESNTTIPLDGPTRAFFQGENDGAELADACPLRDQWMFFAGRAFALRYGQDQSSPEAVAYVRGLNTRKPNTLDRHEHPEPAVHDCAWVQGQARGPVRRCSVDCVPAEIPAGV